MKRPVTFSDRFLVAFFAVILAVIAPFGSLKAQKVITTISVGSPIGSVTYGTAGTVSFPVSFTTSGTGSGSLSTLSINWTAPSGVAVSFPVTIDPGLIPSPVNLTLTTSATTPAGTTSFTVSSTNNANISGPASLLVGQKPITVIDLAGMNKVYDRSATATVTGTAALSGVVSPDVVVLGGAPLFTFASAAIGVAKPISVAGYTISGAAANNYILIQPVYLFASITAKPLTITGLTGVDKVYDGTAAATTAGTAMLSGVVAGDEADVILGGTPVPSFSSAAVGSARPITVTGYVLSGPASGNYTLTPPAGLTANITTKTLNITGLTGANRDYDGTTTATSTGTAVLAGVVAGDVAAVILGGTPVMNFPDALAGNAKPITVTGYTISGVAASNYTLVQPAGLTANVTPRTLAITGLSWPDKMYDGTTAAFPTGTPALAGVLTGDIANVVLGGIPVYTYSTAAAGPGKPITVTGFTISGSASGNYSLVQPAGITAGITPKPVTIASVAADNKPYDATAAATLTGTLNGIIAPDVVTLNGTGVFASMNAGTGIAVNSPLCTLGGADAGNYILTNQPSGLTANITPRPLTIAATGPAKIYGTALQSGISTVNFTATGTAGSEVITSVVLSPNNAGLLSGTPAGSPYAVKPSLATGTGGFLTSNYAITYIDFAGTVSPKPITITPVSGQRKLVGTPDPLLAYTHAPVLLGNDQFTGALSRLVGETVAGSPYAITLGTLSAGTNYSLILEPGTFGITPVNQALLTAFNFTLLPNYPEVINQINKTISVPVASSANVTNLVAKFNVSPGASVQVGGIVQTSGVTPINFTGPVSYVVTSANGLVTETYVVTVVKNPLLIDKQLLAFSFDGVPGATGIIDQTAFTVTVPVPLTYDVTSLKATFTLSPMAIASVGTVIQTSGVTANNFTAALEAPGFVYTIQAENGATRNYYIRIQREAARTGKQLLTFSLPGFEGAVDEWAQTVDLTVPYAYVLTNRIATFSSSFASTVWIGTTVQASGVTVNDFTPALTTGLIYTVKAENGELRNYVVRINRIPASTAKQMLSFAFNGLPVPAVGVLDEAGGTIAVTVPFSANLTYLVATFASSPLSTVMINSTVQVSGVTLNNFTIDLIYKVVAEDLSFKTYTVHVTQAPASRENKLLTFGVKVPGGTLAGIVDEPARSVLVQVPFGVELADLVAVFTISPLATAKIGSVPQFSGITRNNFVNSKQYDIYAEDGSKEVYMVTVTALPAFVSFSFNDLPTGPTGIIDHSARTVEVHVPFTIDKRTLKAYFTVTADAEAYIGATRQYPGVTVNNFNVPVTYRLRAPNGITADYLVNVISDPIRTGKQMLAFAFSGLTPPVLGVINETAKSVAVTLPFGTNVTNLVASFTLSDFAIAKIGTTTQVSGVTPNNFTSVVTYTITAEDGAFQNYTVAVTVLPGSPAKDITYFAFEDFTPDVIGNINQTSLTIAAVVPNGTSRTALRAFFVASPLSTVRIPGLAGGIQASGQTINSFTAPVIYEVTAQDGTTKSYTVTVTEAPDVTSPVVTNARQTVTNLPGQYVILRSNEPTGKVYMVISNTSQNTIAELDLAVERGFGRSGYVSAANTDIVLSTYNLPEGAYYTYAIDGSMNKSLRGVNEIFVNDRLPPTVYVAAQTKSNYLYNFVNVQSSKSNAMVYLILEGVPQQTKAQLDAAVDAKKGARGLVQMANIEVPLAIYALEPGNYRAYAVDLTINNNMSAQSANVVVITQASRLKSILAFSFNELSPPAIGQIIGTDILVRVRPGTPINALVATFTLSQLSNAYIGVVQQVSDVTLNDFTNPLTYRVIAEDGTSIDYTVTVEFNTGIEQSELFAGIRFFPNPVSDKLYIQASVPPGRIQIINGMGQTMEEIRNPGATSLEVQTGSWPAGIYFIRCFHNEKFIGVHKLVKD